MAASSEKDSSTAGADDHHHHAAEMPLDSSPDEVMAEVAQQQASLSSSPSSPQMSLSSDEVNYLIFR
jgi:hypothetical protein